MKYTESLQVERDRCNAEKNGVCAGSAQEVHPEKSQEDVAAERRLRLKIDLAIVPLVSLLYLFCFIDRTNIGNAKIAGLEKDLGLHGYDFNIALTCFAVTYVVCEAPATIFCKLIGPGWFIPGSTVAFGIVAIATGLVQNRTQLFAMRALLGIFESGMMPGAAYYLSRWYRRAELAFRLSFYIATAAFSGAFGGLLASAILKLPSIGTLHGWRMIFVIEGVITVVLGILSFFLLTDRPETARWLTADERRLASDRVVAERVASKQLLDKIDRVKLKRGLTNPVVLATGAMFFMNTITVGGLAFFLPTILATIYPKASVVQQQLYTVAPYMVATTFVVALCGLSWWLDKRQIILIFVALPVITAYTMFSSTMDSHVRYAAAFLVASTTFVPGALTNAQVSANVVSDTSRSIAIAINTFFAAIAAILSIWVWLPFDAPFFRIGNGVNLATSILWVLIGSAILSWMHYDNKRRQVAEGEDMLTGLTEQEIEDLEWKHPDFRWKP
ncbi:unnamed protein product [Discula destructiva]